MHVRESPGLIDLGGCAPMSVSARPAAGVALLALAFTILWWKASTAWFFQLFS